MPSEYNETVNGAIISSFIQSDKNVMIELDDGREILITIKRTKDQDEWGEIIRNVLHVSVDYITWWLEVAAHLSTLDDQLSRLTRKES